MLPDSEKINTYNVFSGPYSDLSFEELEGGDAPHPKAIPEYANPQYSIIFGQENVIFKHNQSGEFELNFLGVCVIRSPSDFPFIKTNSQNQPLFRVISP